MEDDMISIVVNGMAFSLSRDYILESIQDQLAALRQPTEAAINAFGDDGQSHQVKLTTDVWERHLLTGAGKEEFHTIWRQSNQARAESEGILAKLRRDDPGFVRACQDYIFDLRNFDNKASASRLQGTGHRFYIGQPYFSNEVRDLLLQLPTQIGTLQHVLEQLERKRMNSAICASHGLSPIFESVLGVRWDKGQSKVIVQKLPTTES